MIIDYLGHSSFLFVDKTKLVTDPFKKMGFEFNCPSVDYCLCSHHHYDHYAKELLEYKKIFDSENVIGGEEIDLKAIKSFHDEFSGSKRGENIMFKFKFDNITFCHMGDFGEKVDENLCERIGKTDVLLIPVGGVYTINADSAKLVCQIINPKIVIPMHFKTPHSSLSELDGVDVFLNKIQFPIKKFEGAVELKTQLLPQQTMVYLPQYKKF